MTNTDRCKAIEIAEKITGGEFISLPGDDQRLLARALLNECERSDAFFKFLLRILN